MECIGIDEFIANFKRSRFCTLSELIETTDNIFFNQLTATPISDDCVGLINLFNELEVMNSREDIGVGISNDLDLIRISFNDVLDRSQYVTVKYAKNKDAFTFNAVDSSINIDTIGGNVTSLEAIVNVFTQRVHDLRNYFLELQRIDELCWVIEPSNPTYKDNFRQIYIEEGVWINVCVCEDGTSERVSVTGAGPRARLWRQRAELRLELWDADQPIVDNLLHILELEEFPKRPEELAVPGSQGEGDRACAICLCGAEPPEPAPRPLCPNVRCGQYYHVACLYEWLVTKAAVEPKQWVSGKCPKCGASLTCPNPKVETSAS